MRTKTNVNLIPVLTSEGEMLGLHIIGGRMVPVITKIQVGPIKTIQNMLLKDETDISKATADTLSPPTSRPRTLTVFYGDAYCEAKKNHRN